MSFPTNQHPSAQRLQAFLEGDLPVEERPAVERHLTACARCAAERDAWRVLLDDLGGLARLRPGAGFAERVMAGVEVEEPVPIAARVPVAARVRERLRALLSGVRPAHVSGELLQELLEGALPARRMARVQAHLSECSACAASAASWRDLFGTLDGLARLSPEHGFAERVLVRVRAALPAATPSPAVAPVGGPLGATVAAAWRRARSWGGRLVPQTRRAWAALSGIAVTPAVTAGLLLYAVFSHPTLTADSLLAFLWWQVGDLAATAGGAVAGAVLQSGGFGLYSLLGDVAAAPLAIAGGLGAYLVFSALALRVLYKNLVARRPVDVPYARASAS